MTRILSASLLALATATAATPAAARQLTIDDVVSLSRVSSPDVSQDGHWLVWQQRETDLAADKGRYDLWRLDLTKNGAQPEKLAAETDVNETSPQLSADGRTVYFQSNKGGDDAIWAIGIDGTNPRKITDFAGGFSGFRVAPTGDKILVWADRKPGAPSLEPAAEKTDPDAGEARVYDKLFVRHWDSWVDGTHSQLFVLPLTADGAHGNGVAIEHGLDGDTPSRPFGGGEELSWSPDGKTVYFALRVAGRTEELSTNLDMWQAPADGSAAPVNLTEANKATDTMPAVSPDGKWLAYGAMKRPGYESDRLVLMLRNLATGETRALTEGWDRSIGSIAWAADGRSLLVTAEDIQENPIWRVDAASGKVTRLTQAGDAGSVVPFKGGLVYAMDSIVAPADFYRLDARGKSARLTDVNAAKLAGIDWPTATKYHFKGANGDTVWGFVVRPAGLAQGQKAPVAFLVHGGPQGSFNNSWSYRWNPALWAGHGYAVVSVDFHGSTGYGQAFTDAINQDWGGKPLEDLKLGLAAADQQFDFLQADNACALGGSYGGYMMNWIEGRWPDRFKCIVQHDGVFDARAMAYETDELWFDEWEHGGHPYYEDPQAFEKWNPVNYVQDWKTPMLVITGERDFRIPYTQGLAAFTALQRRDIPSKLMVNPNENHWVLKPNNSRQWYREVLGWMDKWTGNSGE